MPYTVYILYSYKHQKHYTGFTSNLEQRLLSHNDLGKGWTSKCRPWKLIYTKEFDSKREAMEYEKWLKTGVGRDFIKTLTRYGIQFISTAADGSSSLRPLRHVISESNPCFWE